MFFTFNSAFYPDLVVIHNASFSKCKIYIDISLKLTEILSL